MDLSAGDQVTLTIEKPAAGGRMIARQDGQVVLVGGAIPGERVSALIERVGKGVVYAQTVSIEDASPDRREPFTDPLCGGCLYAHVAYSRQLGMKSQVIADALGRIGRITLPAPVGVAASPDEGYRMRARMHVRGTRAGFFREGTHEICDARATRQLLPETCDVLDRVTAGLRSLGADAVRELELSENVDASHRAVHLVTASPVDARPLAALGDAPGLTGLSVSRPATTPHMPSSPIVSVAGEPYVTDVLKIEDHEIVLRRHVLAFFQGNRFLLRDLVAHVVGQIQAQSTVIDLYAGAGLFSIAAAASRGARVTAVEGDRVAALDLETNVQSVQAQVQAVHRPVELFTRQTLPRPDTVIVDPPRTGMSREALDGVVSLGASKVVYVSCDVATLARDSRRLLDAGYAIARIDAFDLFPNTPHVETVIVFDR
jgi:23S rRNA (uracil1939-C5)-methyltransferase